ncbi:hypothetical protein KAI87_00985 [Myxococcota bacterium]|nr:hypothetical protein [Myxococcota bacterium]
MAAVCFLLGASAQTAFAEETEPTIKEKKVDTTIAQWRNPIDVLNERMIGSASKPIRFDWRKTTLGVSALGSQLAELNNFDSLRAGGALRMPVSGLITELGLAHVWTWDTASSRSLALTPYRQAGRPSRYEVDLSVGFPMAEGVVTAWPGFFPATEMVFVAWADFRYLVYPHSFSGLRWNEVAGALLSPSLGSKELENIEDERLSSMEIDPARYGIMAGFSTEIYFQTGFYFSPKVLMAVPLLNPMTGTKLIGWWDITLALGFSL